MNKMNKKYVPYLFILPWMIGFLFFFAIPLAISFVVSLYDWNLLSSSGEFIGLGNYVRALTEDPQFWASLKVTLKYALILVPINMFIGFGLALLLHKKTKGSTFFKSVYYIPSIISGVALAMIWGWILADFGILNYFLSFFGVAPIDWLDDPQWALISLVLTTIWANGSMMLIFLGGLNNIDEEVYESARMDGAGKFVTFRKITLPLLAPVFVFNLIMAIIAAFQQITVAMNLTGNGPMNSTYLYSLYVYDTAFGAMEFGYAAALSWIMFIVIAILTALTFIISNRWTYYEDK